MFKTCTISLYLYTQLVSLRQRYSMCVAIIGEVERADKGNDTWSQASLFRNLTCYRSSYYGTNLCVYREINEVNRIGSCT